MKKNDLRRIMLVALTVVLTASLCLSLAACGSGTTENTLDPSASPAASSAVVVEPSASPSTSPAPIPTVVPSSMPSASPTPAATASPSANAPSVTKNPTAEYIMEDGKALFVAKASNYTSIEWRIISADGKYGCAAKDAPKYFSGVSVWGDSEETLVIYNTPTSLNGWYVQATFTGKGGTVYSNRALLSVQQKSTQVSANPAGGTFDKSVTVTLLGQSGAKLSYKVQYSGGYTATGSVFAGQNISISTVTSGTNYAVLSFYDVSNPSNSATYTFTITDSSAYVATAPTADPAGGYFEGGQTVSLYADSGATIYYTLDGSDPHRGNIYTGPFYIDCTCTVMAVAQMGNTYSDIATFYYEVDSQSYGVSAPSADPGYAETFDDLWISLYADPGATIYYTTDGTDPQFAGSVYQGSVYLPYSPSMSVTLRAKAYLNGVWSADSYFTYYFSALIGDDYSYDYYGYDYNDYYYDYYDYDSGTYYQYNSDGSISWQNADGSGGGVIYD